MSQIDIGESLLKAVDILIAERINGLSYDYTKKCTITNDEKKAQGIYEVSDGSTRFEVQGEKNIYKIDDKVRVSVPNGDMTNDKFIVGKWTSQNGSIDKAISPTDTII